MTDVAALRLVLSLLFIIALILVGAWVTRRAGWFRAGTNDDLKILGTRSLGARAYVTLVQVEDARLVLGVTNNQISLLHTLPPSTDPAPHDPHSSTPPGFRESLRRVITRQG